VDRKRAHGVGHVEETRQAQLLQHCFEEGELAAAERPWVGVEVEAARLDLHISIR
jgi:hypothetical protein